MTSPIPSIIGSAATLSLTIGLIRWVVGSRGSDVPRIRDGSNEYAVKWPWRVLGLISATFFVVLLILFWLKMHSRPSPGDIALATFFIAIGVWIASGSVSTDETGITKRGLWSPRTFQWKDITEIRFHKRDGGAIELRSAAQKIIIDTRFEAFQYLLNEIENHTQLQLKRD
jgi:hypothetical protein